MSMRTLVQPDLNSPHLELVHGPIPTANHDANEHLIRIYSVSPCAGELFWSSIVSIPGKEPVPCDDMAGKIVTAPPDSPFQPGDEVYARTSYFRPGCARDYAIAVTEELAHRPKTLSWEESAATALSAETAWQALFEHSGIGEFGSNAWKGKRVLVTAASGGVGNWVVQLGRVIGAEVIGTCGPDNVEFVRRLGASEVINYRTQSLKEWGEKEDNKVDLVIDGVGGKSLEEAWWCIRENGLVMGIRHQPKDYRPVDLKVNARDLFFIMKPSGANLERITKLVEAGQCRPVVDSVWPLEQFQAAFDRLGGGHARGKVVINLMMNRNGLNGPD